MRQRRGGAPAAEMLGGYIRSDANPRPARQILAEIIAHESMNGDVDPNELAEKWLPTFLNRAKELELEGRRRFSPVDYEFNPVNEDYIQGRHFISQSDSEDVAKSKLNRRNSSEILEELHNLSPSQFENLCAIVLRKLGSDDPIISTQSNDQGIDFFGSIPFGKLIKKAALPDSVEECLNVWIFGQAKKYTKSIVKNSELREIIGSVELAKARAYSSLKHSLADVNIRACDPIFYMFITSSEFTSGGYQLIENSGIIAMDGRQLATFLSDHRVGCVKQEFVRAVFHQEIDSAQFQAVPIEDE